jgi:hypothetical protein
MEQSCRIFLVPGIRSPAPRISSPVKRMRNYGSYSADYSTRQAVCGRGRPLRARAGGQGLQDRERSFQRHERVETAVVPDSVCDGAHASQRRRAWQSHGSLLSAAEERDRCDDHDPAEKGSWAKARRFVSAAAGDWRMLHSQLFTNMGSDRLTCPH